MGYHSFYRSKPVDLNNENKIRNEVSQIVRDFTSSLEKTLMDNFPEQYFIQKADGKDLILGAYQPNGRIHSSDKFYAFRFQKSNVQLRGVSVPIQVLDNIAVCKNPISKNGQLIVRADKQITNTSDVVLFREVAQPVFNGTNQMTMTFFGLDNNYETFDGMIKGRINNAMFYAITRHKGLQLIEHDHLASLKKERELQKSEDFIDGHVVNQLKSIGAMYLLKLEDYKRDGSQVSMKISLISVEQNMILRTVDVVSSIDNIENEMYKQLCERIAYPCLVKNVGKDKIELTTTISLTDEDDCILKVIKAVQNPTTGEITHNNIEVCSLEFETYKGNQCVMSIKKIFSQEDMAHIENYSDAGLVTIRIDGSTIKSDISNRTDVQQKVKKEEKNQKVRNTLKKIGNSLWNNSTIRVNGQEIKNKSTSEE